MRYKMYETDTFLSRNHHLFLMQRVFSVEYTLCLVRTIWSYSGYFMFGAEEGT